VRTVSILFWRELRHDVNQLPRTEQALELASRFSPEIIAIHIEPGEPPSAHPNIFPSPPGCWL